MKDENNFRKMNCDDCQCSICLGACMNCSRCYRAEYAEKDWDDYYVPDNRNKECSEFDGLNDLPTIEDWNVTFIYESIGSGQCNKKPYSIWSIFNRESTLMYWYLILFNDSYYSLCNNENRHFKEKELVGKAVDIRTLPNYKGISGTEIIFHTKDKVIPLIKEAVRKGYIVPL